jgi:tRNA pseudouridine32 synthase/23S rRNA pseudouridine746 synthase
MWILWFHSSSMIKILHHDADCVAVLKPAGIAAIPEKRDDPSCLSALLSAQLGTVVMPVHRLDKEVSGVMLYALHPEAHRFLNNAFEHRDVHKTYQALVHGVIAEDQGVITRPIREFGSGRMGVDDLKGKPSETRFSVMKRTDRFTLVELSPQTGRRHQLRVHLYSIGHPIVGDTRYGDKTLQQGFPRLMLTSTGIDLTLPSGKRLTLANIIPDDFAAMQEKNI